MFYRTMHSMLPFPMWLVLFPLLSSDDARGLDSSQPSWKSQCLPSWDNPACDYHQIAAGTPNHLQNPVAMQLVPLCAHWMSSLPPLHCVGSILGLAGFTFSVFDPLNIEVVIVDMIFARRLGAEEGTHKVQTGRIRKWKIYFTLKEANSNKVTWHYLAVIQGETWASPPTLGPNLSPLKA